MNKELLEELKNYLILTPEEVEDIRRLINEVTILIHTIRESDSTPEGIYADQLVEKLIDSFVRRN